MNEIIAFFAKYGLILTLIAVVGVIILGIMKYCNLFKKLPEKSRHYVYLIISIGLSVIATIIYLLIVGQFENYILFSNRGGNLCNQSDRL